jgi:adenosylmethionine-8-amino-7-oxononanoate aminotransferase
MADSLTQDALDYCLFPMTSKQELAEDGLRIYVSGDGVELTDVHGRTYLDMMSAHTRANTLGYGNKEVARAVGEQLGELHYIGTRHNLAEPTIRLAKKMAELAPGELSKTMFVSGGSEAVESAL